MDADVVRAALARGIERGRATDNRWNDTEWLDGEVARRVDERDTLPAPPQPRRFNLVRTADPSGVSGTGTVAVGVAWPSGRYTLEWLPGAAGVVSFGVYVDEADVLAVHGHNGATVIEWTDKPDAFDVLREWCRKGVPDHPLAFDPRVVGTLESIDDDGVATVRTGPEPDHVAPSVRLRMMMPAGAGGHASHHETDACRTWGCRPYAPPDSSRIVVGRDEA